jgi:hypothetical protein
VTRSIGRARVFVDPHDKAAFFSQVLDWSRAGIPRIFRGFASAIKCPPAGA